MQVMSSVKRWLQRIVYQLVILVDNNIFFGRNVRKVNKYNGYIKTYRYVI